jgi:hypothetical protein
MCRSGITGKKIGYDVVEIHAAHGFLLSQIITPYSTIGKMCMAGLFKTYLK